MWETLARLCPGFLLLIFDDERFDFQSPYPSKGRTEELCVLSAKLYHSNLRCSIASKRSYLGVTGYSYAGVTGQTYTPELQA
jgi:hypothetical protein